MQKILIANRGEIAVRVISTCRKMNIRSVAVFSDADRDALHVQLADEAVYIGPAPVEESYLNPSQLLRAASATGAEAIHPGYGFLSENADFARAVEVQGLCWIGPPPTAIETMGSKIRAREIALAHDVPVIPALILDSDKQQPDLDSISALGFPLLIKASAGGGGIGMREVHAADGLETAIREARAQAQRQFSDGSLLVERLVSAARHVEVQVLGDQHGNLVHLHDRDCSLQRRRQKVIEEAPAPGLSDQLRGKLHSAALRLAAAVDSCGAGTVEFLVQGDEFFLLEMNTRLQVEHGVTEAVFGLDLVQLQIETARGLPLRVVQQDLEPRGHAIEARIYAEDPTRQFAPASGVIAAFHPPQAKGLRVDSGIAAGSRLSHHYDGLLCKLIAWGADRTAATQALLGALQDCCIAGVPTNQRFLQALLQGPAWPDTALHTHLVEDQLADYLERSTVAENEVNLALLAATLWQFLQQPPDADQMAWPGGFEYQRETGWEIEGKNHAVAWRWCSRDDFHFTGTDNRVRLVQPGRELLRLEIDGVRRSFRFYPDADSVTVYETSIGSITLRRRRSTGHTDHSGDPATCTSSGPGVVLKVLVAPGDLVTRGDALLVIESMKMESTLNARCSGRISEINTAPGALVESGQLLATIEADTGGTP